MSYALGVTGGTADKIDLVTGVASATLDVFVTQIDKDNASPPVITTVRKVTPITGAATTKITTDPAANHESTVSAISVVNTHATLAQTVAGQITLGAGTPTKLFQPITLQPNEKLECTEIGTWIHYDANGGIYGVVSTAMKRVVLQSGTAQTYTPGVGCRAIDAELVAGGGAGGGSATAASSAAAGAGGGAGGYTKKLISPPASSYTYTIGAGGTGASGAVGGNGGDTTFGALTAKGGTGGAAMAAGTTALASLGGAGGIVGSGGDINEPGEPGAPGVRFSGTVGMSGAGAASVLGGGANGVVAQGAGAAAVANSGGGGGGGLTLNAGAATAGGNGGSGQIVITEYY